MSGSSDLDTKHQQIRFPVLCFRRKGKKQRHIHWGRFTMPYGGGKRSNAASPENGRTRSDRQSSLSDEGITSWIADNFNEIWEHHWQFGRMKICHPHELTTQEAKLHAMQCQLPNCYVFEPWFHGHTGPNVNTMRDAIVSNFF